jgi:hypothetical protein
MMVNDRSAVVCPCVSLDRLMIRSPDVDDDALVLPILRTLKELRPPSDTPLLADHIKLVTPERAKVLADFTAVRRLNVVFDELRDSGTNLKLTAALCAIIQKRCPHHERCYRPPPLDVPYTRAVAAGYRADAKSSDCTSVVRCATCSQMTCRCADAAGRWRTCPISGVTFCQDCSSVEISHGRVWSCGAWVVKAFWCEAVVLHEALSEAERKQWTDRQCTACGVIACPECEDIRAQCAKCGVRGCVRCQNTCQICQTGRCAGCAEGDPDFDPHDFRLLTCHICTKSMHRACGKVLDCADCDNTKCSACAGAAAAVSTAVCAGCRKRLCEVCAPTCKCIGGCGLYCCERCVNPASEWRSCYGCADVCCRRRASAQSGVKASAHRPCAAPHCVRMLCRKCEPSAPATIVGDAFLCRECAV